MNHINDRYIRLVYDAVKLVEYRYILINRYDEITPVKRERVFCYELYHQMRCLQNRRELGKWIINGEIDKRGQQSFNNENPDFIFHSQGNNKNYIVIEVKTNTKNHDGDFVKIKKMMSNSINYKYGIFILIGWDMKWFKNYRESIIDDFQSENIFVICRKDNNTEIATLKELKE